MYKPVDNIISPLAGRYLAHFVECLTSRVQSTVARVKLVRARDWGERNRTGNDAQHLPVMWHRSRADLHWAFPCRAKTVMKNFLLVLALVSLSPAAVAADVAGLPSTAAPAGASVYIISPSDGATVGQDVTVRFGLIGMGVAPAGVDRKLTGHHHLLVDVATLPAAGQPIPADAQHIHFGGGQTQTTLKLAPGEHTLQLELADHNHVPFAPPLVSKKITIHVR